MSAWYKCKESGGGALGWRWCVNRRSRDGVLLWVAFLCCYNIMFLFSVSEHFMKTWSASATGHMIESVINAAAQSGRRPAGWLTATLRLASPWHLVCVHLLLRKIPSSSTKCPSELLYKTSLQKTKSSLWTLKTPIWIKSYSHQLEFPLQLIPVWVPATWLKC